VIAARLDKCFTRVVYPPRRVAERIRRYLEHIGHGAESGTRHVFFGHTHRVMEGFEHGGMQFYNPGAPIRQTPFRILKAEL